MLGYIKIEAGAKMVPVINTLIGALKDRLSPAKRSSGNIARREHILRSG